MLNYRNRSIVRRWLWLAAMLLALGGCAGSATQESTGEFIDDSVITTRVKAAFAEDKVVSARNINVETFKGVVQLSGFANNMEESRKAAEIARSIRGVKSVRNDIRQK